MYRGSSRYQTSERERKMGQNRRELMDFGLFRPVMAAQYVFQNIIILTGIRNLSSFCIYLIDSKGDLNGAIFINFGHDTVLIRTDSVCINAKMFGLRPKQILLYTFLLT